MPDYDSLNFRKFMRKAEIDKAMHTLEGILKGIAIDRIVNLKEIKELRAWLVQYEDLVNRHPFNELIPVIRSSLSDNIIDNEELKDMLWLCDNINTKNIYYDIVTSDIQKLEGMLHGIIADNIITKDEIICLSDWLEENTHLAGSYPYDEIYSIITAVLSDGHISEGEKKLLKTVFADFVELDISVNIDREEIAKLREQISITGICAVCPEIVIPEKVFCFTGKSSKTTRNVIKNTVESFDGIFRETISKQTDYLVVGNKGNPCWAFACYGRKIETAVNLRKSGHRVFIVHENDFWDVLADYSIRR